MKNERLGNGTKEGGTTFPNNLPTMTQTHFMLDLETLGTGDHAEIIQIGIASIEEAPRLVFDQRINPNLNAQAIRGQIDYSTVQWWASQSDEARQLAFRGAGFDTAKALPATLRALEPLLRSSEADTVVLWGDEDFDIRILRQAFERCDIQWPLRYNAARGFRTLKQIGDMLNVPRPKFEGVRHSAAADAMHQAKWAHEILSAVRPLLEVTV